MDIPSLKYFVEVARELNINAVSRRIHVTPSALSKAMLRLEDELGVALFSRNKQRIALTQAGVFLLGRAGQLLQLEQETRTLIQGTQHTLHVIIAGPEVCLLEIADLVRERLSKRKYTVAVTLIPCSEEAALLKLDSGESHFAVVCGTYPEKFVSKSVRKVKFVTCGSQNHPIFKTKTKSFSISEVMSHPFVRGDHAFFGDIRVSGNKVDGWRDDKFPRVIHFSSASLKILEHFLLNGNALAYLPDYYAERLPVRILDVTGCPYTCHQTLKLLALRKNPLDWVQEVIDD